MLGRGIDLAPAAVFDKLVTRRRGGYCFEHDLLFGAALAALGFDTRRLLARVWLFADGVPGRTHVLRLVTLSGAAWIADAGFGGGDIPPMPLVADRIASAGDGARLRLRRDADHGWLLERDDGDGWRRQFGFTTDLVHDADIGMANHWTSSAPASRFTHDVIVRRSFADGAASLTGRRLVRHRAGGGATRDIADAAAYRTALAEVFGIDLTAAEVAALGLFAPA